jgi:hypothetical protein
VENFECRTSEAIYRHICFLERHVLQGDHLITEQPETFNGFGTAVEIKPGDKDI